MKRAALKPKRERPRRKAGRIAHQRMKPKAKAPATAVEQRHLERVADGPCLSCGTRQNIVLHHIMKCPGKVRRRDWRFVARLCSMCHNLGNKSVHLLGSEAAFKKEWGVDLAEWAIEQWVITQKLMAGSREG